MAHDAQLLTSGALTSRPTAGRPAANKGGVPAGILPAIAGSARAPERTAASARPPQRKFAKRAAAAPKASANGARFAPCAPLLPGGGSRAGTAAAPASHPDPPVRCLPRCACRRVDVMDTPTTRLFIGYFPRGTKLRAVRAELERWAAAAAAGGAAASCQQRRCGARPSGCTRRIARAGRHARAQPLRTPALRRRLPGHHAALHKGRRRSTAPCRAESQRHGAPRTTNITRLAQHSVRILSLAVAGTPPPPPASPPPRSPPRLCLFAATAN